MKSLCMSAVFAATLLISSISIAGYPMISDIPNQKILVNTSTPTLKFTVTDDTTTADKLTLSFKSLNTTLIPQSASNVILGGSGSTRTVRVIPTKGVTDTGTVMIIVTDEDGDTNNDTFEVEVYKPITD